MRVMNVFLYWILKAFIRVTLVIFVTAYFALILVTLPFHSRYEPKV